MKYIMVIDTNMYRKDLVEKMMYAGAGLDPKSDLTVEMVKEVSQFQEATIKNALEVFFT